MIKFLCDGYESDDDDDDDDNDDTDYGNYDRMGDRLDSKHIFG